MIRTDDQKNIKLESSKGVKTHVLVLIYFGYSYPFMRH